MNLLLALFLAAPLSAEERAPALEQLEACAQGRCWNSKGEPVAVPPSGAVFMKRLEKIRPLGDKRPKEPPRYTVFTKEEASRGHRNTWLVGGIVGAAAFATVGFMLGGPLGAAAGGLIGAGLGLLGYKLTKGRG